MRIKATVVCENSVFGFNGAMAEHGWSIFLETDNGNYLFDTGTGQTIFNNAIALGIDLKTVQAIILSHHHFDHTGGIAQVLDLTGPVDIYSHPDLFKDSYNLQPDGSNIYLGIPFSQSYLEAKGAYFKFESVTQKILPEFWLTGEVPRITSFELGDPNQVIKHDGTFVKDPILDDQSIIIETENGLVIILGCSHAGLINIIEYAIKITGKEHIHAIIGGTHLGLVSAEQLEKSIEALKSYDIDKIGVSHCTGFDASVRLAKMFGSRFFNCRVGTVLEI